MKILAILFVVCFVHLTSGRIINRNDLDVLGLDRDFDDRLDFVTTNIRAKNINNRNPFRDDENTVNVIKICRRRGLNDRYRVDLDLLDRDVRDRRNLNDKDILDRVLIDRIDRDRNDRYDRDFINRIERNMVDRVDRDLVDRVDRDLVDRADRDIIDRVDRQRVLTGKLDRDLMDRVDRDLVDRADRDIIDRVDRQRVLTGKLDRDIVDRIDRELGLHGKIDRDVIDRLDRDVIDRIVRDRTDMRHRVKLDRDVINRIDRDLIDRVDRNIMDRVDRDDERDDRDWKDCVVLQIKGKKKNTNHAVVVTVKDNDPDQEIRHNNLNDDNVVFVTINKKLGSFTRQDINDDDIVGVAQLNDVIGALRWIRRNIHKYGGDRQRVVLALDRRTVRLADILRNDRETVDLVKDIVVQKGIEIRDTIKDQIKRDIARNVGCLNVNTRDIDECLRLASKRQIDDAKRRVRENYGVELNDISSIRNILVGIEDRDLINDVRRNPLLRNIWNQQNRLDLQNRNDDRDLRLRNKVWDVRNVDVLDDVNDIRRVDLRNRIVGIGGINDIWNNLARLERVRGMGLLNNYVDRY